jgi:GST-like protein
MLTAYISAGPNPRKITILLEELGIEYKWKLVDGYAGDHKKPEYLAVNPNGRLPALHDSDGDLLLWESGAILQYIAEKFGRFLPISGAERYHTLKWLFFQCTHAPYLGNAHLYRVLYDVPHPFDIKRFTIESERIYKVLEGQLAVAPYVAGENYSIADMAWYPWIQYHDWQGQDLNKYPRIAEWFSRIGERRAVKAGVILPWPIEEYGPSERGRKVKEIVQQNLSDPRFQLEASEDDAANKHMAAARRV